MPKILKVRTLLETVAIVRGLDAEVLSILSIEFCFNKRLIEAPFCDTDIYDCYQYFYIYLYVALLDFIIP